MAQVLVSELEVLQQQQQQFTTQGCKMTEEQMAEIVAKGHKQRQKSESASSQQPPAPKIPYASVTPVDVVDDIR